jgi:hypothetical protein
MRTAARISVSRVTVASIGVKNHLTIYGDCLYLAERSFSSSSVNRCSRYFLWRPVIRRHRDQILYRSIKLSNCRCLGESSTSFPNYGSGCAALGLDPIPNPICHFQINGCGCVHLFFFLWRACIKWAKTWRLLLCLTCEQTPEFFDYNY